MVAGRSSLLAVFAALLAFAPAAALGASCDRGEDDVAQALAQGTPEEDGNGSCSFRQLRGEMLPASSNKPDLAAAEEAGKEDAVDRREVGAEVKENVDADSLEEAGDEVAVDRGEEVEENADADLLEEAGEEVAADRGEEAGAGAEENADAGSLDKGGWIPMINYPSSYCRKCGEMAFCHRAGNPGCGGYAAGGTTSFYNRKHGVGCGALQPILTIPRTFIRNIDELRSFGGGASLLAGMLARGFTSYMSEGAKPPFWQCIHKSRTVSVRWLHLHTFCKQGKVDGLPNRNAHCAVMYSTQEAGSIAAKMLAGA